MLKKLIADKNIPITLSVFVIFICIISGFFCGCAGDFPGNSIPKDGQSEVLKIIWNDNLGQTNQFPYEIIYMEGDSLNCPNHQSWLVDGIGCVNGLTRNTPGIIFLAWWEGQTWHNSFINHEVQHMFGLITGRMYLMDPDHMGQGFCDPGEIGPCYDINKLQAGINKALIDNGY